MGKTLILGATSAIAQATARLFARNGDQLFLVARNPERLKAVAEDLAVLGASKVDCLPADLTGFDLHETIVRSAIENMGGLDVVLIAHGLLGDQRICEQSYPDAERVIKVNFLSVVSLLTLIARRFEEQKSGSIVVISSVAGDRGRRSNYVYGSAKGALALYLQGLRNRLHGSGVHVLTIKPGFVDSPMTAAFHKNFLYADPERIATGIYRAIRKKRDVVYLPFYWRYLMAFIGHIPERFFKRMHL